MDLFHNRYQITEPWRKNGDGWLSSAMDPKLNREVLIWRIAVLNDRDQEECLRRLGAAARFAHRRFIHILDVSVDGSQVYAVLTKGEGRLLADQMSSLNWSARDILVQLRGLITPLREARRERVQDFAVTAENLWLDASGRLHIINYWSEADGKERESYGLAMLLYQLCSRSLELPSSIREFNSIISQAMDGLPGGGSEEAVEWAGSAFLASCTLKEFETGLDRLLGEPPVSNPSHAGIPPAASMPPRTRMQREEERERRSPTGAAPVPVNVQQEPYKEEHAEYEEEELQEGRGRRLKPWLWFTVGVFLLGFLGVLGIWYVTRPPQKDSTPSIPSATAGSSPTAAAGSPSASISPAPAATAKPAGSSKPSAKPAPGTASGKPAPSGQAASSSPTASPASSAKPSTAASGSPQSSSTPAASKAPVEENAKVPNLVGQTLEEAERLARQAGLGYEFKLEANDSAAQGTVFKQDLTPGTPVNKGDKIMFWVSKSY